MRDIRLSFDFKIIVCTVRLAQIILVHLHSSCTHQELFHPFVHLLIDRIINETKVLYITYIYEDDQSVIVHYLIFKTSPFRMSPPTHRSYVGMSS